MASVTSPSLQVECGGTVIQTCVIRSVKKKPNFDVNKLILDVVRTWGRIVPYTLTHRCNQCRGSLLSWLMRVLL